MARHTLYAYVEGQDLHEVAGIVVQRVSYFVRKELWRYGKPRLVDQQRGRDWELGFNFDLPDPPQEPPGWFEDVERIALICADLQRETGRGFVLGIGDSVSGISQDLFRIDSATVDLGQLRRVIGVGS